MRLGDVLIFFCNPVVLPDFFVKYEKLWDKLVCVFFFLPLEM